MKFKITLLLFIAITTFSFSQTPSPDIMVGTINDNLPFTATNGDNTSSGNNFSGLPGNDVVIAFSTSVDMSLRINRTGGPTGSTLFLLDSLGNQIATSTETTFGFQDIPIGDYFLVLDAPAGNTGAFSIEFQPLIARFVSNLTVSCFIPRRVFFDNQSTPHDTRLWDFGDGDTSSNQDPANNYFSPGAFDITLTITDTAAGITHTSPIRQVIMSTLAANFTGTGPNFVPGSPGEFIGCGPLTTAFVDQSTVQGPSPIAAWNWDFGDGNTSTEQNPVHTYQDPGNYTVSLTIMLENGCTDTQTFPSFVRVLGPTPAFTPDVTSGSNPFTVNFINNSLFGAPITFVEWDFGDGSTSNIFGDVTHTYTIPGTYDVSLRLIDIDGCERILTQENLITVLDTTPPQANCAPPFTIQLNAGGIASITTTDIDNGSTDDQGVASLDLDITDFDCSNIGENTVTLTVTDTSGNTSTCTTVVTVADSIAPQITCPVSLTVTCDTDTDPTTTGTATATDNCDASPVITFSDITVPGIGNNGVLTRTWTATDASGNMISCDQIITIEDTTPPVADTTTLLDIMGECIVTINTNPTATDNCEGIIVATTTDPLAYTTQGTFTINWTYDDGNGNISTQTQTVIVDDVTAPVPDIAILTDVTAECSATITMIPTATDNCEGIITATTTDPLTYTTQGTFTINWTYDDGNGNISSQTQTVIVNDVTAPVPDIAILPDVTAECSATITITPTATDNCEGIIIATTTDPLTYTTQGTFTINWIYDDGNGNISIQPQTVIVDDVTAPVPDIAILPDVTAECSATITITPTATDNCEGIIIATTTDPLTYTTQGTFTINWSYDDGNGNINIQPQTVIVNDVTAPIANCLAPFAIQLDENGQASITSNDIDNGSTDNCDITSMTIDSTDFDCSNLGENMITLTVTDVMGNTATCTTIVIVKDSIPPLVNCVAPFTVELDNNGQASITVADIDNGSTDNCDIASMTINSSEFDCSTLGENTITLTVTDLKGNSATCTTIVTVIDTIPPTIDCPSEPIIVEGDDTGIYLVEDFSSFIDDNCLDGLEIEQTPPVGTPLTDPSTVEVILKALDSSDNITNCFFTLIVDETLSTGGIRFRESDIKIYPNPSRDHITISYTGSELLQNALLIDFSGKRIKKIDLSSFNQSQTMDLSTLAKGVYFMQITTETTRVVRKIVIR